jgi:radical SAM enzyme (TIGR01210 family)
MNSPMPEDVEKSQPVAQPIVAGFQRVALPKFGRRSTMSRMPAGPEIDDALILTSRGPKNRVDPHVPYAFLVEQEPAAGETVEDVATIFLTNRACPFRCLFCDLWKNTTDARVPVGAIPSQIDYALARLPAARHVKLYNSGNFFDHQAIPHEDYSAIARRVAHFRTVIVENHPKLCGDACLEFRELLKVAKRQDPLGDAQESRDGRAAQLEIAMGLETVHPDILPRLNKQMTLQDFRKAASFLTSHEIAVRAFILLKPPFMSEDECVDWALRSIDFAFDCGARVCSVIPTRSGNGMLDVLERDGRFSPPRLESLEGTLAQGLALRRGRVLIDLWDIERTCRCPDCGPARTARLRQMNLSQENLPSIDCSCT